MDRLLYYIVYGLWYVMSLLPLRVLYVLSDGLYLLVCHVIKYRHRVIWKNLKDSFPEKSDKEIRDIEKGFYRYFCDYLVETVKLMTMSKKQLMKRMRFVNTEEMNRALESGQSVAIYLGHYGNWEWITSLPYWVPDGVQCTEIYHPLENKRMDQLFKSVREKQNALCIPMAESLRHILEYKRQNKAIVVGYISDQAPFWNNIHHWVDFLNHDTPVLTGSEKLVRKVNQATFYGDISRPKRGYYVLDLKTITLEPQTTKDFEITDAYFKLLEENIRRAPHLWLWSHNRWKRTREEFNIRFDPKTGKVSLENDLELLKRQRGFA